MVLPQVEQEKSISDWKPKPTYLRSRLIIVLLLLVNNGRTDVVTVTGEESISIRYLYIWNKQWNENWYLGKLHRYCLIALQLTHPYYVGRHRLDWIEPFQIHLLLWLCSDLSKSRSEDFGYDATNAYGVTILSIATGLKFNVICC